MRRIDIQEAKPGMVLARDIMTYTGMILLSRNVVLTQSYIAKLEAMQVSTLCVIDPLYEGIEETEYISIEMQQQALSILHQTMSDLKNKGTFSVKLLSNMASDLVEELLSQADISICLTGIFSHDDTTFSHSLNCAIYAILLGRFSDLTVPQLKELACGALLHDVGKNEISLDLLNKPEKLTEEEFELLKNHAQWGFNSLRKMRWELSSLSAHMAWQHHERIDGTGYPRGLKGDEILQYARILAIADVYDAITANRPYRRAMPPKQAYDIIYKGLGVHFDQALGQRFLSRVALYAPGTMVVLNTGQSALVVSVPFDAPSKPVIRIITDQEGKVCSPHEISLKDTPLLKIMYCKT
ncbi:MAG: HD-GYP domain-containing protein [Sporomusaceae bacterium]|nr:HD-GYP domain-containing protein [Sporomusaceae bacterium]